MDYVRFGYVKFSKGSAQFGGSFVWMDGRTGAVFCYIWHCWGNYSTHIKWVDKGALPWGLYSFSQPLFFCSKPPAVLYTPWKWIYAEAPSSFSNSNPFLQYMADPPPIKMRVFCMRFSGLFGVSLKKSENRVVTFSLSIIKSNFSKYYTIAIVTKFLVNRSVLNPVNVLSQFLNLRKIQSLLQPPSHNSSMRLRLIFLFKMLYQALTCNFSFQINLEAF